MGLTNNNIYYEKNFRCIGIKNKRVETGFRESALTMDGFLGSLEKKSMSKIDVIGYNLEFDNHPSVEVLEDVLTYSSETGDDMCGYLEKFVQIVEEIKGGGLEYKAYKVAKDYFDKKIIEERANLKAEEENKDLKIKKLYFLIGGMMIVLIIISGKIISMAYNGFF